MSGPVTREKDSYMDVQIHFIETEAYGAVLRAFITQSEVLSWGKEELITELRKELRVSDAEHREILGKINLDESIKSIREWRKGTTCQQLNAVNPSVLDPMHVGSVPRKRLKPAQTPVSSSPKYPPRALALPVILPPSVTPHARDGQWNSNTVVLSPSMQAVQPVMPFPQNRQAPSSDKARWPVISQTSKKVFIRSGFENMEVGPDVIEIRATDKLINEVEKICGGVNPDPGQVERAKLVLREHERALMNAIGKLTSLSDDDDSPAHRQKQHQFSNEERERNTQEFPYGAYKDVDRIRSRINYGDGYILDHSKRTVLCMDFQNGAFDKGC